MTPAYAAEYGKHLSNHLPMALFALQKLGADDATREKFTAQYVTRLEPLAKSKKRLDRQTWASHRSQHRWQAELADLFAAEFRSTGRDKLLERYVPQLMDGVAAGAFHGLIRLAYGIEADDTGEVVQGLAHWADTYLPLSIGRAQDKLPPAAPEEALARLSADDSLRAQKNFKGTIFEAIAAVAKEPAFARHANALALGGEGDVPTLGQIASVALRIYASTRNFTALHLVTSAHAMRLVLPWTGEPSTALRHYWNAFLAAQVTTGKPSPRPLAFTPEQAAMTWDDIAARAVQSPDEHTIKLVHTLREEEKAYGGDEWRIVAAQRVLA